MNAVIISKIISAAVPEEINFVDSSKSAESTLGPPIVCTAARSWRWV